MNYNLNLGLKGEYKVDIYSGKRLMETTDWFSNDITNWGLTYPFNYSFARCFMFLSLGSEAGLSDYNQTGTGLLNAIKEFTVVSDNGEGEIKKQSGQYIGWEGYEIGEDKNTSLETVGATTCGTSITQKGIRMYRGWTIPTGNSDEKNVIGGTGLTINQFMVSPSSGSDQKGNKAFSLVNRTIIIPSGYYATITYQLSIDFLNYSSPYTFFSGKNVLGSNGFFDISNAATGVNGSDERELLSGWSNLSGIFRQVSPGFEIVNGVGACVSPTKMGNNLEPYKIDCYNTFFYLSPNISQFCLNGTGGYSTQSKAYNSIGLMNNYYEFAAELFYTLNIKSEDEDAVAYTNPNEWFYSGESLNSQTDELEMPINSRLNEFINISNYLTGKFEENFLNYKTKNYTGSKNFPVAFATPGKIGFNSSFPDFGQRFVRSTYLKRMPIDINIKGTGTRFKYVTKKAIIPPLYSYGTNSRYGSLTLGYNNAGTNDIDELSIYPYIDFVFFDNEGRASNMSHYRYIPTIYLKDRGSGISKIRFDIIEENGGKPNSINRFWSAYGFMGSGVSTSINSTGLSGLHPYLVGIIEDDLYNPKFIPNGNKPSGFLLPGQILNENVPGDLLANNGTGYGSVYGIIASSGFYSSPYDLCLLDIPNWSGLGGDPSETLVYNFTGSTGYTGNLSWPHFSKKIKLRLSELEYYSPTIGNFSDTLDYFKNYQIIKDIQIPKSGISNTYESIITGGTNSKIYICDINGNRIKSGLVSSNTQNFFVVKDNNNNNIHKIYFSPLFVTEDFQYGTFTGFLSGFSLIQKGYGSNLNFPITLSGISGLYRPLAEIPYALSGFTLKNDLTSSSIPNTGYSFIPEDFKKPEAYIYHVETTGNNIGYRLLPNYATANTGIKYSDNIYNPVTGGTFPGLSMENGMELYITLSWTGI
jgi:hypothetical protein